MIRALIVDDEPPAREKLRRWLSEQSDIQVIAQANDGIAGSEAIERLKPDVVFLDIQMPGLSGLEVASQLESETAPMLIFVTAYDEHAVRAFDLNAVDYLLKPFDKDRLLRCLTRIRKNLAEDCDAQSAVKIARARTASSDRLLVPVGETLELIDAASVQWLEADDNYVHVHTATRKYMLRRTLSDLLLQLGEARFTRVHKSSAVNLAEVQTLTPLFKGDYEIVLRSGHTLRLSRRYKDDVFARMQR